jgi:probable rRNA maturation factor
MMTPSLIQPRLWRKPGLESVPSPKVDVQVFPAFARRVSKAWLRNVAAEALRSCEGTEALAISLVIADDETVRDLNRVYRGLDETTDVLAFSLGETNGDGDQVGGAFPIHPEEAGPFGEIVISYPQAARQSSEGRKPVNAEIALLVVHGALHLLGYDHADPQEEKVMWAKQDQVLTGIPLK